MFCSWIFLPCQIGVTTSRCVHSYNTVHDWSVMFLRVVMLSSELTLCDWQTVVTCFGGSWRLTPNNASRSSRPCNIRGSAAVSLSMSVCLSVCLSLSLSLCYSLYTMSQKKVAHHTLRNIFAQGLPIAKISTATESEIISEHKCVINVLIFNVLKCCHLAN